MKKRDPMARDLRTPKYKPRVVQRKDKVIPRKEKHDKGRQEKESQDSSGD